MRVKDFIAFSFIYFVSVHSTCNPRLFVPPGDLWPNDTPKPLKKGGNAIVALGGYHGNLEVMSDFPIDAQSGIIEYRYGIIDQLEASADISFLHINTDDNSINVRPYVAGIRIGIKYSPTKINRIMAFRLGSGFGTSEAGQYVPFDYGIILGFENPYIVPFSYIGGYVSIPFNTKYIFFDIDEDDPEIYADIPQNTWGLQTTIGFKVYPPGFSESMKNNRLSFCLYPLVTFTTLNSRNAESETAFSLGGGIEFLF